MKEEDIETGSQQGCPDPLPGQPRNSSFSPFPLPSSFFTSFSLSFPPSHVHFPFPHSLSLSLSPLPFLLLFLSSPPHPFNFQQIFARCPLCQQPCGWPWRDGTTPSAVSKSSQLTGKTQRRGKCSSVTVVWKGPKPGTYPGCSIRKWCLSRHWTESEVSQSCLIPCNTVDCSLPRSSVRGIFQARVLEWGAISFISEQTLGRWMCSRLAKCRRGWVESAPG